MKSAAQDILDGLDGHLAAFRSAGEVLESDHEFIANFVGSDAVLERAYGKLVEIGFRGDPPAGGGWIYMHVWRPLTCESVIKLTKELDGIAHESSCLFELLDVTLTNSDALHRLVILGNCDGEAFLNA